MAHLKNNRLSSNGCGGGGQMVTMLAFSFDNGSSNLTMSTVLLCKIV